MSDPVKGYLEEVLALDPLRDAEAIVALRDRMLSGGESAPAGAGAGDPQSPMEREEALRRLGAIRDRFWDDAEEDLGAALAAVDTDQPDLLLWKTRLRSALGARGSLALIREDRAFPRTFVDLLCGLVLAPGDEAARLRLQQRDRTPTSVARSCADRVRTRYPRVFALEREHFSRLMTLKRDRQLARPATVFSGFLTIWILWMIFRAIHRLLFP